MSELQGRWWDMCRNGRYTERGINGAGPIGLLAALLGRLRGLDVMVFDQVTDGHKPKGN